MASRATINSIDTADAAAQDVDQTSSKKALIYPPLDIKTIVDKTAEHVSKSGPAFEQLIRDKYRDNAKFSFIYANDPYFAYYEHMVARFRNGDKNEDNNETSENAAAGEVSAAPESEEMVKPEKPPMLQFVSGMPAVSALDLDVIRTTAQFVARNGRSFMAQLAQRESGNYQFDFLQPTHSLFGYFRKLVDQYSLVFFPPPDLTKRVHDDCENKYKILNRVNGRMQWTVYEQEEKKRLEDEREKEKEAFLAIDWHDFVVVGTVEFVEEDMEVELPLPLRLNDLKNLSLEDKHKIARETGTNAKMAPQGTNIDDDVEMEVDDDDDDDEVDEHLQADKRPQVSQVPLAAVGAMKIRRDYVPMLRRGAPAPQTFLRCQLCGIDVAAADFDEHIRVELIDPKWKEQKQAYERKIRDSNLVQEGMDIARYLRQLAVHRVDNTPDGVLTDTDAQGQQQQQQQQAVPWDGFSSTAGRATKRAREGLTAEEQDIAAMRRKGLADPRDPALAIGPQMPGGTRPPAKHARRNQQTK
ncbi:SF3a splicing factor complex subunit [Coemansia sp. RSA 1722]|nr:SF3a splicing factor complex subunit [Coemansia sp. RSA 485]KAJ2589547.1 SF3a splicing factor complex subunit [Coemansia sp. RSA 1722]